MKEEGNCAVLVISRVGGVSYRNARRLAVAFGWTPPGGMNIHCMLAALRMLGVRTCIRPALGRPVHEVDRRLRHRGGLWMLTMQMSFGLCHIEVVDRRRPLSGRQWRGATALQVIEVTRRRRR